jgi:hypothetical protein
MSNGLPDKEFLDNIRETLDRNADDLDEKTLLGLRRIRLDALEVAGQRQRLFAFPRLITAGGIATVAVLAVTVSIWSFSARQRLPVNLPEDVEVLVVKDHFDLYEDLDFYRWLDVAESKGNGR